MKGKWRVLATERAEKRGRLLILTWDGRLFEDDIPPHCLQMAKHALKFCEVAKTGFRTQDGSVEWNRDFTGSEKKEVVS